MSYDFPLTLKPKIKKEFSQCRVCFNCFFDEDGVEVASKKVCKNCAYIGYGKKYLCEKNTLFKNRQDCFSGELAKALEMLYYDISHLKWHSRVMRQEGKERMDYIMDRSKEYFKLSNNVE